jgi:hypothetical protein
MLAAFPGLAAGAAFPDGVMPAESQGSFAPPGPTSEMRRKLAREAEHPRIHTPLGDPGHWRQPVADLPISAWPIRALGLLAVVRR